MEKWLDFSSLTLFMTCPQRYYWRIKLGLEKKGGSIALEFGKCIHEALASWHINKDDAKALSIFQESFSKLNFQEDTKRNLSNGISILKGYFDRWRDEIYQTIQTEIGFAIEMDSPVGEFIYIGKIDRFVDSPYGKAVMETKTTSIGGDRWLMRGKPNMQVDGYIAGIHTITGEFPSMAILDIIHIHEKNPKPAQRVITTRTKEDIERWAENVAMWWTLINSCDKHEYWNRNTEMCVPILGYTCQYQTLCQTYPFVKELPEEHPEYTINFWHPYKEKCDE